MRGSSVRRLRTVAHVTASIRIAAACSTIPVIRIVGTSISVTSIGIIAIVNEINSIYRFFGNKKIWGRFDSANLQGRNDLLIFILDVSIGL